MNDNDLVQGHLRLAVWHFQHAITLVAKTRGTARAVRYCLAMFDAYLSKGARL